MCPNPANPRWSKKLRTFSRHAYQTARQVGQKRLWKPPDHRPAPQPMPRRPSGPAPPMVAQEVGLLAAHSGLSDTIAAGRATMALSLKGKVAIITGASSGIGRAAGVLFAREGAKVVLAARRVNEGENVAKGIQAAAARRFRPR